MAATSKNTTTAKNKNVTAKARSRGKDTPRAKGRPKAKAKANGKAVAATARSLVAAAPAETSVRCPLPPSSHKHVVFVPDDAKVGAFLACVVNHRVRVTSTSPPSVEPA